MKKLLTILLIYFFVLNINAQGGEEEESAPAVEIFFITENLSSSPIAACTLTAQSQVWRDTLLDPYYPGDYYLTDYYNIAIYTPQNNNMGAASAGFDFVSSQQGYPVFALGLYKVTSNVTNKYFYLDYRDQRASFYSDLSPTSLGHPFDIWIKYDGNEDEFSFSTYSYTDEYYVPISNGQLLSIWDIKEKGNPFTGLLPDYWENSLALINNGSNNPRFVWGPYPENLNGTITGYNVYRSAGHAYGSPPSNFSLLQSLGSNTFNYSDGSITMGTDYDARSYYITCVYEDPFERTGETDPTNIVEVRLETPQKLGLKNLSKDAISYNLYQNYPNPFNPNTKITFSILRNENVKIKISNILGQELFTLLDEVMQAGEYSLDFTAGSFGNAYNLPSGVYIYTMQTPTITLSKKMILAK